MLTRFWLPLFVALLATPFSFSKDRGYYLPLVGYTTTWSDNALFHGGRLGMIGYTVSEDFRLEIIGSGCFETLFKLPIKRPVQRNNTEQPTHTPPKTPLRRSRASSVASTARTATSEISCYPGDPEQEENPWRSDTTQTPRKPLEEHTPDPFQAPQLNETPASRDTSTQTPVDTTFDKAKPHDETPSHHNPPTPFEQPTPTPAPHSPEPSPDNSEGTRILWGGASLVSKWTFLHLHPQCRLYWGPGFTFLYPKHTALHPHGLLTLGWGVQWIASSALSIDCTHMQMFRLWGDNSKVDSFFSSKNKTFAFNISLNWHF